MSVYVFHVVHVYLSYLVSSEEMQELGVAVEVRIMHQMDLVTLDVVVSVPTVAQLPCLDSSEPSSDDQIISAPWATLGFQESPS
jgi:hypothetical protein